MAVFPRTFPRRGEVYAVDFNPARGSEQAGTRPALVISNDVNNQHSPVVILAAITSTVPKKRYPFNVHLPAGPLPSEGTIMCGQLMTVDKTRLLRFRAELGGQLLEEVDRALAVSLKLPKPQ